jgi:hypothetical protein
MNIQGLIGWLEYTGALDPCHHRLHSGTRIRFILLSAGVFLIPILMSGKVLGHLVFSLSSVWLFRAVAHSLQHVPRGLVSHPHPSYLSGK